MSDLQFIALMCGLGAIFGAVFDTEHRKTCATCKAIGDIWAWGGVVAAIITAWAGLTRP